MDVLEDFGFLAQLYLCSSGFHDKGKSYTLFDDLLAIT